MNNIQRIVLVFAFSLPCFVQAEGTSVSPSAQGALFNQLQQMHDEIAQLRGMIEENQNTIKQLKQENLERYKDLDQRISSESSSGISQKTKGGTASSSTKEAASTADNSSADPAKEKLYYDASFDFIKTKDFDKATKAFNAFLRKYPDSKYAGNAQYWLGEVSLATNDLPSAQKNFAKVSKSYPEHSKVPDSLYKLGDVEVRLGNKDKAKTIFQQVVSKYPNTSAAKLSQNELKQL